MTKKTSKKYKVLTLGLVAVAVASAYCFTEFKYNGAADVYKNADLNVKPSADYQVTSSNAKIGRETDMSSAFMGSNIDMSTESRLEISYVAPSTSLNHTPAVNIRSKDMTSVRESAPATDVEIEDNRIKLVSREPVSTFSTDADDGSYKLFKSNLNNGHLIDSDFVRTEEFVNAFQYNYDKPESLDVPFSTNISIQPSPWSDNHLLKIGVKGYEYTLDNLPPVNLTFLVDVSGSMRRQMPTIKTGLKMLVDKLRPEDRISIVTYAGNTSVVLQNTPISNKSEIIQAISILNSGGGTNGSSGIMLAYKENESHFIKNGVNRIILMSDGDFNVGLSGVPALQELIKEKRASGVTFSTIGIGGSNYQDQMMEQMANKGNGNYTFLGDINDARSVFADRFISTIKNIAKDVKFQIEFNADNVKEYRLIGYENRMLQTEDFNNDQVDAGEIPSGATTTAIYEITLSDQAGMYPDSRYGEKDTTIKTSDFADELAFLKIRFKQPTADVSELLTFQVDKALLDRSVDDESRFVTHVAGFAQIYRNSDYISSEYTYQSVIDGLSGLELDADKLAFLNMVKTTAALKSVE